MSIVRLACTLIGLASFSCSISWGQQQPMFTQYMFNGLIVNPAYAGAQETFVATAIMRKQWAGFKDAPQTQTFSAHSPLDNLRNTKRPGSPVSLGITLFHDRVAITDQTGLLASYAYRIRMLNRSSISFGLQGGISQYSIRYSELDLNDPAFASGDVKHWQADFGAGVYYQATRFYAGISAPQMLRPRIVSSDSRMAFAPHIFVTMGYVFDISADVKLKPNILLKNYKGEVSQIDLNCNVFLNEVLNFGLSWRSLESLSALFQLQLNPRFALGYAYDYPYQSAFAAMSNGSHEVMLNYRVPRKNIRTINPRFF